MKNLVIFLFFYLLSCGYPDIDSVPSFNKTKITDEELIDLCQLSSTDNIEVEKCIKEKLKINEKY